MKTSSERHGCYRETKGIAHQKNQATLSVARQELQLKTDGIEKEIVSLHFTQQLTEQPGCKLSSRLEFDITAKEEIEIEWLPH